MSIRNRLMPPEFSGVEKVMQALAVGAFVTTLTISSIEAAEHGVEHIPLAYSSALASTSVALSGLQRRAISLQQANHDQQSGQQE